jgi:tetratricopeptide (TPR) repeat protein/predicted Ser/Thr protein kinase
MECPEENVIVDFVRGELPREERACVEAHIDGCGACSLLVVEMARIFEGDLRHAPAEVDSLEVETTLSTTEGAFSPVRTSSGRKGPVKEATPLLPQGSKLGRYVVLERIGSGGMGVVYAAYDPELDRKVALKVLRHGGGKSPAERQEQRTRLLREAQAMAKLSHPNVITVHDVGTVEGQVFLAMEFIEGRTLGQWMKDGPHDWRRTLSIFRAAAQGLAAAHAAGLVHRDFKPDNVLMGTHGRVLVTDFGLARPAAGKTGAFTSVSTLPSSAQLLTASLTQTGALVGTPAYMAPEQLAGERTDALSDQFSFCVALYEALYGERPFEGRALGELMANVSSGHIRPPPQRASVPRWVRRVILRGLATEPEERFADMTALLAALRADPSKRLRRLATVGIPGTLLFVGIVAYQQAGEREAGYCDRVDAKLAGIWDDDRRAAMDRAFAQSDRTYADDAFVHVAGHLDGYSETWVEMQSEACRDQLAGEQPQAVIALRMACLGRRLSSLRALTDLLVEADASTVEGAVDAVRTLPRLDICADLDALTQRLQPLEDPEQREAVDALEHTLAQAKILRAAAKYDEMLEVAHQVVERAKEIGYRPLEAEGLMLEATALDLSGRSREAETAYHRALSAALAAGHAEVMARVSVGLVWLTGVADRRLEEAERWATHGLAAVEQLGSDPEIESELHHALGVARLNHGALEEAGRSLREAVRLREEAYGPDHPSLGGPVGSLAQLFAEQDRLDEAIAGFERARDLVEREYGARHPSTATASDNLGNAYAEAGQYARAYELQARALKIRTESLGPSHPWVAASHQNISITLLRLGRTADALEHVRTAVEIDEKVLGPQSLDLASALTNLASVQAERGELDDALAHDRRALDIARLALGERHPRVARYLHNVATRLLRLGRRDDAVAAFRQAVQVREASVSAGDPPDPDLGRDLLALTEALLSDPPLAADAVDTAERAVQHAIDAGGPTALAQSLLSRALALPSDRQDTARAVTIARQARTTAEREGDDALAARIDRFLAELSR